MRINTNGGITVYERKRKQGSKGKTLRRDNLMEAVLKGRGNIVMSSPTGKTN